MRYAYRVVKIAMFSISLILKKGKGPRSIMKGNPMSFVYVTQTIR